MSYDDLMISKTKETKQPWHRDLEFFSLLFNFTACHTIVSPCLTIVLTKNLKNVLGCGKVFAIAIVSRKIVKLYEHFFIVFEIVTNPPIHFKKFMNRLQTQLNYMDCQETQLMLPPCHFLLYSSNTIVTLTEETNRSSHSDTKKLDHFITCNIIV